MTLLRDTATGSLYVFRQTENNSVSTETLVPFLLWRKSRRDQVWNTQISLSWRPWEWLSLRGTWTRIENISNLEDVLDDASYVRQVVSGSASVSW
jgi:hypothetical protein